jgi:UvrD-like helicase family protein
MARLHLDATRSSALFAERMIITEGVTEGAILRQFGRSWAGHDDLKRRFIEALTITIMGCKPGRWPVDLLAAPDHEIASRIAVFTDTDKRPPQTFTEPSWISDSNPAVVQGFYNRPTLEPAFTPGNEEAVREALKQIAVTSPDPFIPAAVDTLSLPLPKSGRQNSHSRLPMSSCVVKRPGKLSRCRSMWQECSTSYMPPRITTMPIRSPLTSEQRAAATTAVARAFIVAAPGSGKTTVAAERFGVIRYDTAADFRRILALSFTRSARGELAARIRRRWGSRALAWPH